ncbi:hypothetical protein ACTXT7_001113 [Hymenolepis weldensis]
MNGRLEGAEFEDFGSNDHGLRYLKATSPVRSWVVFTLVPNQSINLMTARISSSSNLITVNRCTYRHFSRPEN